MKIGSAVSLKQRVGTYQTGSPFRDYRVHAAERFQNRTLAERILHQRLDGFRVGDTEWFLLHPIDAQHQLQQLARQEKQWNR